ncbi:hypothetical protein K1719_027401 [Acacia pycnantha]|nr:hypothetical protein K1719_027401 [Acacia pycnantha]
MASIGRKHVLSLLFILTFWTSHVIVMSRKLHEVRLSQKFEQWSKAHSKMYENAAEKEKRFKIVKDNLEFTESFNAAGNKPYRLSINQLADQSREELKTSRNGIHKRSHDELKTTSSTTSSLKYKNVTDVPTSVDWRQKRAVTPSLQSRIKASVRLVVWHSHLWLQQKGSIK